MRNNIAIRNILTAVCGVLLFISTALAIVFSAESVFTRAQTDGWSVSLSLRNDLVLKVQTDAAETLTAYVSDGADGKQVELRVEGGYIQWKYDADSDWQNLIALSALQGIKGDKGDKGDPGEDGDTPYIGDNGNWWIGGVDTGIKAEGSDGADGSDGSDGKDGQDGKDGEDGKDGLTPYIGSNGNWWIGTTDTGIKAAGVNGADGKDGKDGINGKDGANGKNGANGKDGADGVGIADIKLNENGELIVTLTDGTEKNLGKVKGEDGVGISGVSINENGELISFQELETSAISAYREIQDTVYYGISSQWQNIEYNSLGEANLDISYLWYRFPGQTLSNSGYLIDDLNGDHIPELIISTADAMESGYAVGMIYDLYTYQDGQVVHLISSGERDRYYLCEDSVIANEGSAGAADSMYFLFSSVSSASL